MRKSRAKRMLKNYGTIYGLGFRGEVLRNTRQQDLTPDNYGSKKHVYGGNCFIRNTAYAMDEDYSKVEHDYIRHWQKYRNKMENGKQCNTLSMVWHYMKSREDIVTSKEFDTHEMSLEEFYYRMKGKPGKYMVAVTEDPDIKGDKGHLTVLEDGHFSDEGYSDIYDYNWFVRFYATRKENAGHIRAYWWTGVKEKVRGFIEIMK